MKKLNKKIGSLALAGALLVGGFAVGGVQASALWEEEVQSVHLNSDIDLFDEMLRKLGSGSHKLYETYGSEEYIRNEFREGVASSVTRLYQGIRRFDDKEKLETYLGRLINAGFDAFAVNYKGLYYLIINN